MAFGLQPRQSVIRSTYNPKRAAYNKFTSAGFDVGAEGRINRSGGGDYLQQALQQLSGSFGGAFGGGGGDSFQEYIDAARKAQTGRIEQSAKDLFGSGRGNLAARGLGSSNLLFTLQKGVDRQKNQALADLDENILRQQFQYDQDLFQRNLQQQQLLTNLLGGVLG